MGGTLATGASIYMESAGVPAADGAGLSSIKSFSQLLTSIAAMPLAGGTFIGHVLFTDNTYDIGASGATRPRTVYAGTSVITPLLNNTNASALTLGNSTYGVTVPGFLAVGGTRQWATLEVLGNDSGGVFQRIFNSDSDNLQYATFGLGGSTAYGISSWVQSIILESTTSGGISFSAFNTSAPIKFTFGPGRTEKARFSPTNGHLLIGTTTDDGTSKLQVAGAATFSGDISMSHATQGYIRAYAGYSLGRNTNIYHDTSSGYVNSSYGGLFLTSQNGRVHVDKLNGLTSGGMLRVGYDVPTWVVFNGQISYNAGVRIYSKTTTTHALGISGLPSQTAALFECEDSGGNDLFTVEVTGASRNWSSGQTKYTQTIHDGTKGILSTSSGDLNLVPAGGTVAVTGGITASGVVSHGAYTVATLPAAGSNAGKMAQVTDSNVAASGNYGATVAAGGANRVKVFSDGTNWVIA